MFLVSQHNMILITKILLGDDGIFVTRIIEGSPAYFDGRLQRGDQILSVDNVLFKNVTHQFAVQTLKNTGERVSILYMKNPHPELPLDGRQLDESDRSRSLQVKKNFSILTF
jgi:C-terminal processing protease CtpA/Prc